MRIGIEYRKMFDKSESTFGCDARSSRDVFDRICRPDHNDGWSPSLVFLAEGLRRELDSTSGEIEVELIDKAPDFGFVLLPQRTFEGPNAAKVPEQMLTAA